jgi:putative ABC transport system substrate-binding protein
MIGRREFITLMGGAAAWPLAARAQPVPVIGYLKGARSELGERSLAEFWAGLNEMGFVEGRNLLVEYRVAEQNGQFPMLAGELVNRKVVAIFAGSLTAATAAKAATATIPIVFTGAGESAQPSRSARLCASRSRRPPPSNDRCAPWPTSPSRRIHASQLTCMDAPSG